MLGTAASFSFSSRPSQAAVSMANMWNEGGKHEYIWVLELNKKTKKYSLKARKNIGRFPGNGTKTKCEKQEKWEKLWEKRNKEECDLRVILKGGDEELVHSKVFIPLSKFMKGVLLFEHDKSVRINCNNFSPSAIRSLVAWAYSSELTFNENDLLDVFRAVSFFGFERLYCRLINAAFGKYRDVVDRKKYPEIVRIEDKQIKSRLLEIIRDKKYTEVPERLYEKHLNNEKSEEEDDYSTSTSD